MWPREEECKTSQVLYSTHLTQCILVQEEIKPIDKQILFLKKRVLPSASTPTRKHPLRPFFGCPNSSWKLRLCSFGHLVHKDMLSAFMSFFTSRSLEKALNRMIRVLLVLKETCQTCCAILFILMFLFFGFLLSFLYPLSPPL